MSSINWFDLELEPLGAKLYEIETVDNADARAWTAGLDALPGLRQLTGPIEEYRQQARDPKRSQALYRTIEGTDYQTFIPAPTIFEGLRQVLLRREYEATWRDMELAFATGRTYFSVMEGTTTYEGPPTPAAQAPYSYAYAITGHSGIGKTLFLSLALLRCLQRHWTVVLQMQPYSILIFNFSGVYSVSYTVGMAELSDALPRATWCLVDSNDAMRGMPYNFLTLDRFLIRTAAPQADRLSWGMKKQHFYSRYLIKPMPAEEAQLAYSVSVRSPNPDSNRIIQSFFDKYGPSTRSVFQAVSAREKWEEAQSIVLQSVLERFDFPQFRDLVSGAKTLQTDDQISHHILLVEPADKRHLVQADLVSAHMLALLAKCFSSLPSQGVRLVHDLFSSDGRTKDAAIRLVEDGMHALLAMPGHWPLTKWPGMDKYRMVVSGGSNDPVRVVAWNAAASGPVYDTLAVERINAGQELKLAGKYYQLPKTSNYEKIDSFIYNPQINVITAFHLTTTAAHFIDLEGLKWLKSLRGAPGSPAPTIDLVVVSPDLTLELTVTEFALEIIRQVYRLRLRD
ncbi:uncharacterized protein SCHCODRAFT_02538735 [Schizophyllum commune H4-8]|nr:uncharacterized protein SCHCODRAFT_02538735 [Schizophyllum commune H4-8]KAI5893532.1 hypothetical protein SCHCODRAFT_02538735 [Schizophyllum commune H4-8]